ncbi:MAG TPA: hypothetical protein VK464_01685 [Symbiobacteriaceae bacterium]|nr:hypothetical protein [Symbiobacteriaceae bacterium]
MTRTYYRLALAAVCALAACAGPVAFLEDRVRLGYLLGGLAAALLAWAILVGAASAEANLHPGLLGIIGAGAALLSWATITLVAVFDVLPHALAFGLAKFDPVWLVGGLAPLIVAPVAWWRVARGGEQVGQALLSSLYRFSVPLLGLRVVARVFHLPKQYGWLFLFTGVMFLVLDGLGAGDDLPLVRRNHMAARG